MPSDETILWPRVQAYRNTKQEARKEFAISPLVEPGASDVEELETWHEAGEREGINRELRDRLIGPSVGFVVENVHRTIPDLQKIDMAGEVARLVRAAGVAWIERLLRNNAAAELGLDRRNILLHEPDRNLDATVVESFASMKR